MNKLFALFSLFIFSSNTFAYIPTVESLFRNGNNADIGNNTVVASFYITRMNKEGVGELTDGPPVKTAFKLVIGNDNEEKPKLVQLDFRNGVISDDTMNRIFFKQNFALNNLGLSEEQDEKKLFYSLISSLVLNKSKMMMNYIKTIDPNIQKNKELIDRDQLNLLNSYRSYLTKKNNEENIQEIENPLKPQADERKEYIKTTMSRSMLNETPMLKRVYKDGKFFWEINSEKIYAKFTNSDHQLKRLVITTANGKIELDLHHYILFGGGLEFPEIIYFKDLTGQMYEIKMMKMSQFKDNSASFFKRIKRYEQTIKESQNNSEEVIKPPFVM
jgi:hypothetical protein